MFIHLVISMIASISFSNGVGFPCFRRKCRNSWIPPILLYRPSRN